MPEVAADLLRLAGEALDRARRAGARDAAASAFRAREVGTTFRDGRIETVKDATSRGLSLRVYVDDRFSVHDTCDLRPGSLDAFVSEAVALTKRLEPDPDRVLPDPSLHPKAPLPNLDLDDPAVAAFSRDQRIGWLAEMDDEARSDARVLSATCEVSDGSEAWAFATTSGFAAAYATSSVSTFASVTVRDEDDKKPEDYAWSAAHHASDLPAVRTVAAEARARALNRLGAVKGPTAKATMIVEPRAAASLVARLLAPATARAVQQQSSMFLGRIGEQLFPPSLTIVDDPCAPRGLGSRPFDGEGLASERRAIVQEGRLERLYVDTYYGRKVGLAPTSGSPSNLFLATGERDLAGWMNEVGSAILVTSWIGGNADGTTGDFSLGCRGFLVEQGVRTTAVQEMNVTGNLLTLFRRLRGIGSDPFRYASLRCPTLVFEGVSFSGG
jgi:PmbA protein